MVHVISKVLIRVFVGQRGEGVERGFWNQVLQLAN
jgi:hypothetical protein